MPKKSIKDFVGKRFIIKKYQELNYDDFGKVFVEFPGENEGNFFLTRDHKLKKQIESLQIPIYGDLYKIDKNYVFEVFRGNEKTNQ